MGRALEGARVIVIGVAFVVTITALIALVRHGPAVMLLQQLLWRICEACADQHHKGGAFFILVSLKDSRRRHAAVGERR